MSEYEAQCGELLSEPDNIEIIREQIGAILTIELRQQHLLAQEAEDPNADDYDVDVYVESDSPGQYVNQQSNPFPMANVVLAKTVSTDNKPTVGKQNMRATFFVDLYATGNTACMENKGTRASMKAWKAARLVRNILRSEQNTYLQLRGIVGGVRLDSFEEGMPEAYDSAIKVRMVRITLTVDYMEDVPYVNGEDGVQIIAAVTDENGRVLIDF